MATNLQNAINLYERGIRDGEVQEVLDNYMGSTYTQHSTGVRDGKEGFAEFFADFFRRNPKRDIRVVRSFFRRRLRVPARVPEPERRGGAVGHHGRVPL